MGELTILPVVERYLQELQGAGIPVEAAVLFGSYARGQQTEDSDIDLIVLSPRFDQGKSQADMSLLWRLRRKVDARIEPIAAGSREYFEDRSSPVLEYARREGIRIGCPPR